LNETLASILKVLTENHIISFLTVHLKKKGFEILQSLRTNEKGVDIIAKKGKELLYIEAKGETSSKEYTSRFGKPFEGKQIKTHVSRAILTSMILLDNRSKTENLKVAIALPDTKGHRALIEKIQKSLKELDIKLFWVSERVVIEQ
jgi:Holliday junction resolvase